MRKDTVSTESFAIARGLGGCGGGCSRGMLRGGKLGRWVRGMERAGVSRKKRKGVGRRYFPRKGPSLFPQSNLPRYVRYVTYSLFLPSQGDFLIEFAQKKKIERKE